MILVLALDGNLSRLGRDVERTIHTKKGRCLCYGVMMSRKMQEPMWMVLYDAVESGSWAIRERET